MRCNAIYNGLLQLLYLCLYVIIIDLVSQGFLHSLWLYNTCLRLSIVYDLGNINYDFHFVILYDLVNIREVDY